MRPLMIEASKFNTRELLGEWKWLVPPTDTPIFLSALGDWVFGHPDGSLWGLSVLEGTYERIAATFPKGNFVVVEGVMEMIDTSPGVARGHCAKCGTGISYQHVARPAEIDLTLASLGDPIDLRPTAHIWVEDKVPWLVLNDGLPQYPKTTADPTWSANQ